MKNPTMDGKAVADRLRHEMKARCAALDFKPGLAVVWVGDNPASEIYIRHKQKACEQVGIHSVLRHLPADSTQAEVEQVIQALNTDPAIHGILVQMPLPQPLDEAAVILAIDPAKDVDGLHPVNSGYLFSGAPGLVPCTPLGIMALLESYGVDPAGKQAVVIGRSQLVGKPVGMLLLNANATVSFLHSRTPDLSRYTRDADIVVVAVGRPNTLTREMVKPGAVVIDVGINRLEGRKITGDVDFHGVSQSASLITPVPGGVGPMTIAMLLENTLKAAQIDALTQADPL
jgi:methylenetetrahydrofolate dehydrogenase (NADP+) / methenyltetrahydrofolate cyclohydrolase